MSECNEKDKVGFEWIVEVKGFEWIVEVKEAEKLLGIVPLTNAS